MDNNLNIRQAALSDLEAVRAVEQAAFDADRFSRRQLGYLISHACGAFYVAETEGRVAGYLSLLQRSGSAVLRIYSIAVHPEARGQGIAQRLIDRAKEYARSNHCRRLSLEVRTDNAVAIGLYRKNGFTVVSLEKNYYDGGKDAFRMVFSSPDDRG